MIVAIDPGVGGTGVALFRDAKFVDAITLQSSYEKWEQKIFDISNNFSIYLSGFNEDEFETFIEMPAYMTGGGLVVAQRGDLVKLSIIAGILSHAAHQFGTVKFVPVYTWKGQLPKSVCEARIRERIDLPQRISNHAIDAVGIGLWALEKF